MILSDSEILVAMKRGEIVIEPFDPACLGGNSYDIHLGPTLLTYDTSVELDCYKEPTVIEHTIGPNGFTLHPGVLYLGSTVEYTETHKHVPYLDGRSSIGRLGISIHVTAGRGDCAFFGHWTTEISVIHPVRVYANLRIGQLTYHMIAGQVQSPYRTKANTTYGDLPRDPRPVPSRMWIRGPS